MFSSNEGQFNINASEFVPKFNLGAEEFVPKFGEEEMNFQPEVQVGVKMAQSVNFCVFFVSSKKTLSSRNLDSKLNT